MTSPEITDAMVEAAALAYAKACGKCNRRGIRAALSAALAAGAPFAALTDAEWAWQDREGEPSPVQQAAPSGEGE